jgi:hypothetical protein
MCNPPLIKLFNAKLKFFEYVNQGKNFEYEFESQFAALIYFVVGSIEGTKFEIKCRLFMKFFGDCLWQM